MHKGLTTTRHYINISFKFRTVSNCPPPAPAPAPAPEAAVADPVPGPSGDTDKETTPSKRKTKSQQATDDHFEKILKLAQSEDHPVELAMQAIAKQVIRTLDDEEQDEILEQFQTMSASFFRERRRKLRASKKKSTASAAAAVAMPPPPPLVAQPNGTVRHEAQPVENMGDILFEVAGELPPMNQYNLQYVRDEQNGTTYMKM